jgi:hypothetical protein
VRLGRIGSCAFVAFLCSLAGAPAAHADPATVLVLGRDGSVRAHREALPPVEPRLRLRPAASAAARRKGPTVLAELARLRDAGAIAPDEYDSRRATYEDAKALVKRLSGTRRAELAGVLGDLDSMAARGQLTGSRIGPLWLTLERNRQWWTNGPLLGSGQRVGFSGSELVWQHYPGHGIQIQWLGTFGKLNALWKGGRRNDARLARMLDEVLPLAGERAGGIAWEYLFPFDGGAPPWVSGLAQGTALQALARAASRLGRQDEVFPIAARGLAIFEAPPPEGVRVAVDGGAHYLQYSALPGVRIINGFVQSLVGLFDFAELTGDQTALELFAAGDAAARVEVPTYDTGAWSLYSRGTVTEESDLAYHKLLRDFLSALCTRTADPVFCGTAEHLTSYLTLPPALSLATTRLTAGRVGALRFRLSKVSRVSVRVTRAGRLVLARDMGTIGRGTRALRWRVPRARGTYRVTLSATDLAGNRGSAVATVKVTRPGGRS